MASHDGPRFKPMPNNVLRAFAAVSSRRARGRRRAWRTGIKAVTIRLDRATIVGPLKRRLYAGATRACSQINAACLRRCRVIGQITSGAILFPESRTSLRPWELRRRPEPTNAVQRRHGRDRRPDRPQNQRRNEAIERGRQVNLVLAGKSLFLSCGFEEAIDRTVCSAHLWGKRSSCSFVSVKSPGMRPGFFVYADTLVTARDLRAGPRECCVHIRLRLAAVLENARNAALDPNCHQCLDHELRRKRDPLQRDGNNIPYSPIYSAERKCNQSTEI
jgi:hypothetical protein